MLVYTGESQVWKQRAMGDGEEVSGSMGTRGGCETLGRRQRAQQAPVSPRTRQMFRGRRRRADEKDPVRRP